jgi:Zn-finger nucleic acid-binding protein
VPGVWLDRGGLEKLLHSAQSVDAEYERGRQSWIGQSSRPREPHPENRDHYGQRKKESRFSDLFDIFDRGRIRTAVAITRPIWKPVAEQGFAGLRMQRA